jgi:hypothetical protein
MSEFEHDPSANTAGFRAFVERGEEDTATARRLPVSPALLVIVVLVIVAIILIVTLA